MTSLPGFAGASGVELTYCAKLVPIGQLGDGNFNCTKPGVLNHTVIQALSSLPRGVHAPNTLVTEHAVDELRISSEQIGPPIGWFVNGTEPLTAAEIHNAQAVAVTGGLSIETKERSADVFDRHQLGHFLRHRVGALHLGDERRADPKRDCQRPKDTRRNRSEQLHPSYAHRRHGWSAGGWGGSRHIRRLRRGYRLVTRRLRQRWPLRARKCASGKSVGDPPWPASLGGPRSDGCSPAVSRPCSREPIE